MWCIYRIALGSVIVLTASAVPACAQDFPTKPIRFILPYSSGGSADVFVRTLGKKMSESLKQQVVADARPGGSGIIATEMVARAAPDGYTMLMVNSATMAVNPALYPKLSYDPMVDFAPISKCITYGYVLVVHPALPVKSVKEMVALAGKRPGELRYGSAGMSAMNHLAGEIFSEMTRTSLTHVPYKGSSGALTALLGGETSLMFDTIITSVPFIKAGRLRAIAVTSITRSALIPQTPTMSEQGIVGYELTEWNGVVVPAATPRSITDRLYQEIIKALKTTEVLNVLVNQGGNEIVGNSPEEFRQDIQASIQKYARLLKTAGIKAE